MIESIFIKNEIFDAEIKREIKEEAELVGSVPVENV
jgi:hypothetical protein